MQLLKTKTAKTAAEQGIGSINKMNIRGFIGITLVIFLSGCTGNIQLPRESYQTMQVKEAGGSNYVVCTGCVEYTRPVVDMNLKELKINNNGDKSCLTPTH